MILEIFLQNLSAYLDKSKASLFSDNTHELSFLGQTCFMENFNT